jgi:hypothetical protein
VVISPGRYNLPSFNFSFSTMFSFPLFKLKLQNCELDWHSNNATKIHYKLKPNNP